jgi:general secretion pathway protein A
MYLPFYGLRELPFELTPNPKYLFLTPRHREVLCNLQYGITSRRGVTVLIGEAGTGKTTLVHAALGMVDHADARCVYLNNPTLTRAEFVECLAHGFGLTETAARSKAVFLRELDALLRSRLADGVVSALLIDEAQSLPHDLLEEVRLLANMETATDKLLQVVLAGQPELADRLNEQSLRQLKQRAALRCELLPLQLHETAAYIAARLERAGGSGPDIFTAGAVAEIHARARGIPRSISVICDNALVTGFATDTRPVDHDIVTEVCRDLDFPHDQPVARPSARPAAVTRSEPVTPPGLAPSATGAELFASLVRRRFSFF